MHMDSQFAVSQSAASLGPYTLHLSPLSKLQKDMPTKSNTSFACSSVGP